MRAKPLNPGGTIGICSPSHIAEREKYDVRIDRLRSLGFRVVEADNLYSRSCGYLASPEERGADLNQLIADSRVELVLFGGGEGSNELLPYIDFASIEKNPKRILSYSDATTILGAIWAKTGLEVYYGQMPDAFFEQTDYDLSQFMDHIVGTADAHEAAGPWMTLKAGQAEGILVGGYLKNFAMQMGSGYFPIDTSKKYVLFLEDNIRFGDEAYVSAMLTHIQLSGFMSCVSGLLFGHYDTKPHPFLYNRLAELGEKYDIPVAYCDDFGHGQNHAILDMGRACSLNTRAGSLLYD